MTDDIGPSIYDDPTDNPTDFLDETPPLCGIRLPEPPEDLRSAEEVDREDDYEPLHIVPGEAGYGDVRRRHLLVLMPLPEYLRDKEHPERGIDYNLQGLMLDSDIREAMAKCARKLNDTALKYTVTGYTWSLDDIVYDMPQPRTVSGTLVIERG